MTIEHLPIHVREAAADDVAAITAIYRPAVIHGTASFELDPPDVQEMARRMEVIVQSGNCYLVALSGGEIVGYAYFGPYRPRPAYRWTVENAVYIAPGQQRRGVGRILMADLIRRAEGSGLRQMVAVIGDSANHPSIGLHASMGFQHCGIVKSVGHKHGRWLDQVIMQRSLGMGDEEAPTGRTVSHP